MQKHKIAFLISHPTQYHSPLFRELAKNPAVDLTVYFCSKSGLEEHFDPGFGQIYKWDIPLLEGYKYVFLKNISPKPAFNFFGQIHPGIIKELKEKKYDALISHGYTALTYWLAFLGCWLTRTPLILKGESDLSRKSSAIKKIFKRIILKPLFRRASAFLYSYNLNKEFFRFYGAQEEKLFFCPSAVDNNFFRECYEDLKSKKAQIKKDLGIKNTSLPNVLFVGKFIPRKRAVDILEAAKLLSGKVDFNILLVGDGREKEKLIDFVKKNDLDNVYFAGFKNQTELPKFYSIADVFVLPSEYDPSPKALNEAMNFELPAIVSDGVKTAPDLVLNGNCGFVYPRGDVSKLAENIQKILTDNQLRLEFGKNALSVVSKWSFGEDVRGILNALKFLNPNF